MLFLIDGGLSITSQTVSVEVYFTVKLIKHARDLLVDAHSPVECPCVIFWKVVPATERKVHVNALVLKRCFVSLQ